MGRGPGYDDFVGAGDSTYGGSPQLAWIRVRVQCVVFSEVKLDWGAWRQNRKMYWDARPAPVYVEVQYLLLGSRAVAGWYIPVVPARGVILSG